MLILLGWGLLHQSFVAVLDEDEKTPVLRLTLILLAVQFGLYLAFRFGLHHAREMMVLALCLTISVQGAQSIDLLRRHVRRGMVAPVTVALLVQVGFVGYNLFRSGWVVVHGVPLDLKAPNPLETLTSVVYLCSGLGLGFAVFWMSSARLRLRLEHMANTDSLTGLYNRRVFRTLCEKELLRSLRSGQPFSLMMIDVDHFKRINDEFGHRAGDHALCAVADALREALRGIDEIGRWGGEEFMVLLPGAGVAAAVAAAERMRQRVEALKIFRARTGSTIRRTKTERNDPMMVTVSIGVATFTEVADLAGDGIDELFHRADQALYEAKTEGRNRVLAGMRMQ
jgi:diguanylate cyclase (GGDEF)-like protein